MENKTELATVTVRVTVMRDPSNESESWQPTPDDVARELLVLRDLDADLGWKVVGVGVANNDGLANVVAAYDAGAYDSLASLRYALARKPETDRMTVRYLSALLDGAMKNIVDVARAEGSTQEFESEEEDS